MPYNSTPQTYDPIKPNPPAVLWERIPQRNMPQPHTQNTHIASRMWSIELINHCPGAEEGQHMVCLRAGFI